LGSGSLVFAFVLVRVRSFASDRAKSVKNYTGVVKIGTGSEPFFDGAHTIRASFLLKNLKISFYWLSTYWRSSRRIAAAVFVQVNHRLRAWLVTVNEAKPAVEVRPPQRIDLRLIEIDTVCCSNE
jgi:hypothetical protein